MTKHLLDFDQRVALINRISPSHVIGIALVAGKYRQWRLVSKITDYYLYLVLLGNYFVFPLNLLLE